MMYYLPPQPINLTIIDAFLLFVLELVLIVFLIPKLKFRQVWESILIINLLKVGLISLIIPLFSGMTVYEYNELENYFMLLLILGFIISVSVLRKDLNFTNEQVILYSFLTTFISSSFWKIIYINMASIYAQPYLLMRNALDTEILFKSEGLSQNFNNFFGLLPILILGILFYFRRNPKTTHNLATA